MKTKFKVIALLLAAMSLVLVGCGKNEGNKDKIPEIDGLEYESTVKLQYAEQFQIFKYKGGYSYIRIEDGSDILVVPKGKKAPANPGKDVVTVNQPLDNVYMAATSAMALVNVSGGLDRIKFSSLQADGWYIPEATDAMNKGQIKYAGKYNTPDYEMLTGEKCDLAVESTMILHNPEVKEKLEELGIKVVIERSSYETHPLGRTEWVKFYGTLLGLENEAAKAFDNEVSIMHELEEIENTGKTVAFFYINSSGGVVTRKSDDYVSKMISIAGGNYIFENLGDPEKKTSTVNMQMEEFYASAKDADYIFYNSSIVSEINSIEELIDLSPVLADFKAVKEGNVWCTGKNLFQETDKLGSVTKDMNTILTTEDKSLTKLDFFFKVQ